MKKQLLVIIVGLLATLGSQVRSEELGPPSEVVTALLFKNLANLKYGRPEFVEVNDKTPLDQVTRLLTTTEVDGIEAALASHVDCWEASVTGQPLGTYFCSIVFEGKFRGEKAPEHCATQPDIYCIWAHEAINMYVHKVAGQWQLRSTTVMAVLPP